MKVAIFLHNLNGGGAEKIMVEFLNYLVNSDGCHCELILAEKVGPYLDILDPKVKLVVLDKGSTLKSIFPLLKYLRDNKVDVLYSTLLNGNLISIIVGKILGIKVVIREANTIEQYKKTNKGLKDNVSIYLIRQLYKYCFKCIAISEVVKKDLVRFTNISASQIQVIYNPLIIVDTKNVSVDDRYFNVAFVSRLTVQKNINSIAKIISQTAALNKSVKFHFFGVGDDDYILKDINISLGYEVVVLYGFELSYYSYIKNMDMFIHIPLWEGLGNSVLEVYNANIPMILSNVDSGYKELIHSSYSNVHYFDPQGEEDKIVDTLIEYSAGRIPKGNYRPNLNLTKSVTYKKYFDLINTYIN